MNDEPERGQHDLFAHIYHDWYENFLTRNPHEIPRWQQTTRDSLQCLDEHDFPNPLHKPAPRILQAGAGSPRQIRAFVELVHKTNPKAPITTIDKTQAALAVDKQTRSNLQPWTPIKHNLLDYGFNPGSLDWIDAQQLLVFIAPENLNRLFASWASSLARDGVVTLREMELADHPVFDRTALRIMRRLHLNETYIHTIAELKITAHKAGLEMIDTGINKTSGKRILIARPT